MLQVPPNFITWTGDSIRQGRGRSPSPVPRVGALFPPSALYASSYGPYVRFTVRRSYHPSVAFTSHSYFFRSSLYGSYVPLTVRVRSLQLQPPLIILVLVPYLGYTHVPRLPFFLLTPKGMPYRSWVPWIVKGGQRSPSPKSPRSAACGRYLLTSSNPCRRPLFIEFDDRGPCPAVE